MKSNLTSLARSYSLFQKIKHEINQNGGQISFAKFMTMALYAPELGYYTSAESIFGAKGDFMTAPEYSPLFARCIASFWKIFSQKTQLSHWLEFGAGSGQFAVDFLYALSDTPYLPSAYFIVERSQTLRLRQQKLLSERLPFFISHIHWLDAVPENFQGCLFANEVIDALPVHCIEWKNHILLERCVSHEKNQFIWSKRPASLCLQKHFQTILQTCSLPNLYQSEIRMVLPNWIQDEISKLKKGVILLIDYGYGRKEYYHPARTQGTLTGFFQHQRIENVLAYTGLCDLTAHVDFTQLAELLSELSLKLQGFTTQAGFLLEMDLLNQKNIMPSSSTDYFQKTQMLKKLIFPSEMGETTKVLLASTDPALELPGFSLQDRRRDL